MQRLTKRGARNGDTSSKQTRQIWDQRKPEPLGTNRMHDNCLFNSWVLYRIQQLPGFSHTSTPSRAHSPSCSNNTTLTPPLPAHIKMHFAMTVRLLFLLFACGRAILHDNIWSALGFVTASELGISERVVSGLDLPFTCDAESCSSLVPNATALRSLHRSLVGSGKIWSFLAEGPNHLNRYFLYQSAFVDPEPTIALMDFRSLRNGGFQAKVFHLVRHLALLRLDVRMWTMSIGRIDQAKKSLKSHDSTCETTITTA